MTERFIFNVVFVWGVFFLALIHVLIYQSCNFHSATHHPKGGFKMSDKEYRIQKQNFFINIVKDFKKLDNDQLIMKALHILLLNRPSKGEAKALALVLEYRLNGAEFGTSKSTGEDNEI